MSVQCYYYLCGIIYIVHDTRTMRSNQTKRCGTTIKLSTGILHYCETIYPNWANVCPVPVAENSKKLINFLLIGIGRFY